VSDAGPLVLMLVMALIFTIGFALIVRSLQNREWEKTRARREAKKRHPSGKKRRL
jgi:hypothetical protein